MALDYRQVIAQATTGWWRSCEPGTSCSMSIDGTTTGSGAVASVYLTDLIVTSTTTRPVHLYIINGTSGGTTYLLRKELTGTNCIFNPDFKVYPRTSVGTGLYIHAESVANGTVCLSAGGFNV